MPSTGAAAWRRAAVLTTSPATIPSPSEGRASRATTASPVLTAMRTCRSSEGSPSFSSRMASRTASAARTARSGSSCSARPVKPTRSAKKTVTTLRSSRAIACSAASGAAQALQKRAPSGFSWPHSAQTGMSKAYESGGRDSRLLGLARPPGEGDGTRSRRRTRLLGRLQKHCHDDDASAGDRGGGWLLRNGDPDPERPEDDLEQRDQSHLGGGQEPRAYGHEGEAETHLAHAEKSEEQKVTLCSRSWMCEWRRHYNEEDLREADGRQHGNVAPVPHDDDADGEG